jgi:hypothetical protein
VEADVRRHRRGSLLEVSVRTRRGRGQLLQFFCVGTKWTTPRLLPDIDLMCSDLN